jgi:hypothetical protein
MEGNEAKSGHVDKQVVATGNWGSNLLETPGANLEPAPELSHLRAWVLVYESTSCCQSLTGDSINVNAPVFLSRESPQVQSYFYMQEKAFGFKGKASLKGYGQSTNSVH